MRRFTRPWTRLERNDDRGIEKHGEGRDEFAGGWVGDGGNAVGIEDDAGAATGVGGNEKRRR